MTWVVISFVGAPLNAPHSPSELRVPSVFWHVSFFCRTFALFSFFYGRFPAFLFRIVRASRGVLCFPGIFISCYKLSRVVGFHWGLADWKTCPNLHVTLLRDPDRWSVSVAARRNCRWQGDAMCSKRRHSDVPIGCNFYFLPGREKGWFEFEY